MSGVIRLKAKRIVIKDDALVDNSLENGLTVLILMYMFTENEQLSQ